MGLPIPIPLAAFSSVLTGLLSFAFSACPSALPLIGLFSSELFFFSTGFASPPFDIEVSSFCALTSFSISLSLVSFATLAVIAAGTTGVSLGALAATAAGTTGISLGALAATAAGTTGVSFGAFALAFLSSTFFSTTCLFSFPLLVKEFLIASSLSSGILLFAPFSSTPRLFALSTISLLF